MDKKIENSFRLPAEWEQQSGIMLIMPHEDTDWEPYLKEIISTYVDIIDAITRYEDLLLITRNIKKTKELFATKLSERQIRRIIFFKCDNNDTWARDVAPISLINEDGVQRMLDFCFNGWGEKFPYEKDNKINLQMAQAGIFNAEMKSHKDFILEGGSIESDGKGTLFTTTSCLLAPHRNEPFTQKEITSYLLKNIPSKRIIWLEHGSLKGDDTDGHIDTIVRCAPNDTLLYIKCEDKNDVHYSDFKKLEVQLKTLRTLNDKPYRLLALPFPEAIYDNGERLPATYANFVILNGAVLVPTYNQPKNDAKALEIIKLAFSGYDIIGIDAQVVIRQHGSLHCLTMQLPKGIISNNKKMNTDYE